MLSGTECNRAKEERAGRNNNIYIVKQFNC